MDSNVKNKNKNLDPGCVVLNHQITIGDTSLKKLQKYIFFYGCSVILIIVAVRQMYIAHYYDLSPWRGGGFGMFSTIDAPSTRFIRVYLILPDGEEIQVQNLGKVKDICRSFSNYPKTKMLERMATVARRYTWLKTSSFSETSLKKHAFINKHNLKLVSPMNENIIPITDKSEITHPENIIPVLAVRIEFWKQTFDAGPSLRAKKIDEVTVIVTEKRK